MQFAYIIIVALMSMVVSCGYPLHSALKYENLKFPQLVITPVTSPIEVRYRAESGLIKSNAVTQDGNNSPDENTVYMLANIEERGKDLFWLMSMTINDPQVDKRNPPIVVANIRTTPLGKELSSSFSFPALEGKTGKEVDEFKQAMEKMPGQFIKGISSDQVKTGDVWGEADIGVIMDDISKNLRSNGYNIEGPCMQGFKMKVIFKGLTQYKNKVAIVTETDNSCRANIISYKDSQGPREPVIMRFRGFSVMDRHTLFPLFSEGLISFRSVNGDTNGFSMYMKMESK